MICQWDRIVNNNAITYEFHQIGWDILSAEELNKLSKCLHESINNCGQYAGFVNIDPSSKVEITSFILAKETETSETSEVITYVVLYDYRKSVSMLKDILKLSDVDMVDGLDAFNQRDCNVSHGNVVKY